MSLLWYYRWNAHTTTSDKFYDSTDTFDMQILFGGFSAKRARRDFNIENWTQVFM